MMDLKNSKTRFRSVFDIFIISAANGMDTNQRTFFVDEKKNGNVKSLTQSYFRSPCLPGRMKLSGSGTEVMMFSQLAERSKRGNFKQLMTFVGVTDVLNRFSIIWRDV